MEAAGVDDARQIFTRLSGVAHGEGFHLGAFHARTPAGAGGPALSIDLCNRYVWILSQTVHIASVGSSLTGGRWSSPSIGMERGCARLRASIECCLLRNCPDAVG
jgi:hypothetical protein